MEYDLTGQRFGRLVALACADADAQSAMWVCECDCGNYAEIAACELTSGRARSCGCLPEGSYDLAGLRFGTLVAVDPQGFNEAGALQWRCLCDCGQVRVCSDRDLLEDRIFSCDSC